VRHNLERSSPLSLKALAAAATIAAALASRRESQEAPQPQVRAKKHRIGTTTAAYFLAGAAITAGVTHEIDLTKLLPHKVEVAQGKLLSGVRELDVRPSQLDQLSQKVDRLSGVVANQAGLSQEAITGANLKDISSLPGYGQEVSPEQRARLEAATIKIGMHGRSGLASSWGEWCTGVKVTHNNQAYVLTAAHCFEVDTAHVNNDAGPDPNAQAVNVLGSAHNDYAILDPQLSPINREVSPMALVKGVAVDTSGNTDWALLLPAELPAGQQSQGRFFDQIPAIPLEEFVIGTAAPVPGQKVALYSAPLAGGNKPVVGTGIYLGRLPGYDFGGRNNQVDFVAIPALDPEHDAGEFGGSGSIVGFTNGFSGPLSARINNGYPNGETDPSDNIAQGWRNRPLLEQKFGIRLDINDATTIGEYAVPSAYEPTFGNLERVLRDPNDIPRSVGSK
jgi:hypothetical protein